MVGGLRAAVIFFVGLLVLTLAALAMLVVRVLRPWQGRRVCQEVIGAWAGDVLLWMVGVEVVVHGGGAWPEGPCFYMANHSSSLDMPILMSLRLPNTRTFIKERFRWYGPLGLVLALTGSLFTAPQEQHERRVARFIQATERLRRTGDSAFGSPEGTRVTDGQIGPFNRGVFHIVTELHLPIQPLLIVIPASADPGKGVNARAGVVHVYVGERVDTSGWTVEDIDRNKEAVRDRFVTWREEIVRS